MCINFKRVSSASWYIINLFGLRSMYNLVLGENNAADQTKMMQDQMSGAALSMPDDLNKAFKVCLPSFFFVSHFFLITNNVFVFHKNKLKKKG